VTALYIIAILILALTTFALYRSKRSSSTRENQISLPPMRYGGLFGAGDASDDGRKRGALSEASDERERRAASLRERAARGDFEALLEAREDGDEELYDELLDVLLARVSSSEEATRSLASFIREHANLRASGALVEVLLRILERSSDVRALTPEVLHVAALSGDASVYEKTIVAVLRLRREGRIALPAGDLRSLIESHYWTLAPEARSSGAGFVLKQTLADARRSLQTDGARRASIPTETLKQSAASEEEKHEYDS
jgi:hypothetical protein